MSNMPPPPPTDPGDQPGQYDDNFAQLPLGPPPWSKSAVTGFIASLVICIPGVSSAVGIIAGIMGIAATAGGHRRGRGLAIAAIPISLLTGAASVFAIMFALATITNTLAMQTTVEDVFRARDLSDADLQEWIDSSMSAQAAALTSPAKIRGWIEEVFADKGTLAEIPAQMRSEPVPGANQTVFIFPCRFVNGVADVRVTTAVTFEDGVNFLIENIEIDEHSLVSGP